MRKFIIAAAALMVAGSAFAQTSAAAGSTIANVLAKGTVMNVQGMDIEFTYKPDGTFDGGGLFAGKYKVDGNKICLEIPDFGVTSCSEYPDGKKSGDSFQIQTDMGPIDVKIK
jgi:phosphate-selective porin